MTDDELVCAVRDRIYACMPTYTTPAPEEMPVSAEEFDACERAVQKNLKLRGLPPIPFTRTGRGMLFKNVEIYIA